MPLSSKKKLSQPGRQALHSVLSGLLGACIALLVSHGLTPRQAALGAVDITGLVDRFIQSTAQQPLSTAARKRAVAGFARELDAAVRETARQGHLVLLPREAVMAGAPDYTGTVLHRLQTVRKKETASAYS